MKVACNSVQANLRHIRSTSDKKPKKNKFKPLTRTRLDNSGEQSTGVAAVTVFLAAVTVFLAAVEGLWICKKLESMLAFEKNTYREGSLHGHHVGPLFLFARRKDLSRVLHLS